MECFLTLLVTSLIFTDFGFAQPIATRSCKYLTSKDGCRKFPLYMRKHCARSCGICLSSTGKYWLRGYVSVMTCSTFAAQCNNRNPSCEDIRSRGGCLQYPWYMKIHCKNVCQANRRPLKAVICGDRQVSCKKLSRKGGCGIFPVFMRRYCKRSCGRCARKTFCRDANPTCRQLEAKRSCLSLPWYMNVHCRHTCKKCPKEEKRCIDHHLTCLRLSRSDGCKRFPVYTRRFCGRSCRTCSPRNRRCKNRNPTCKQLENLGGCSRYPWYTNVYCRRTCKKCRVSGVVIRESLSNCQNPLKRAVCHNKLTSRSYRTFDGTCNNLKRRTSGAASTAVRRFLKAQFFDELDTPRGFPTLGGKVLSAFEVADRVFDISVGRKHGHGSVSLLHMIFGQFIDHDVTLIEPPHETRCANPKCPPGDFTDFTYPCFPILVSTSEDKGCFPFTRSFPVCPRKPGAVRQNMNFVSAYADLSQVYGKNTKQSRALRTNDGTGRLKMQSNLLPPDSDSSSVCSDRPGGCYLAGDIRVNENIALVTMHTLFAREHNRLARKLAEINSNLFGEKLFEEARKILIAKYQHILFEEWVPFLAKLKPYRKYNSRVNVQVSPSFSTAAFRYGHSQIPNSWEQLDAGFNRISEPVTLQESFTNNTSIYKNGIEPTILGLCGNNTNTIDRFFAATVLSKLFVPVGSSAVSSLVARNIQRGRDHGIPTYNDWWEVRNNRRAKSFREFKRAIKDAQSRKVLKEVYRKVDDVELFVGGLAEEATGGSILGPTFQWIIKKTFESVRDGDRYFYKNGMFSGRQREEIERTSMASLLCNNIEGIVSLQSNPFRAFQPDDERLTCDVLLKNEDLSAWRK